jgi:uncharacterized membrane protein YfhO
MDVDCPGDAFLVLSERFDDGWGATIDGTEIPVRRAYGLVLGVSVPPGQHRLEVRYRPPGFWPAALVSALVALGIVAAGIRSERRVQPRLGGAEER